MTSSIVSIHTNLIYFMYDYIVYEISFLPNKANLTSERALRQSDSDVRIWSLLALAL